MDDNEVKAFEEQLERIAAGGRADLAKSENQYKALSALNFLGAAIRDITIERTFGSPDSVHVARKFGLDQRLDILRIRYARVAGYLEPGSKRWFEEDAGIPAEEPVPIPRTMPGPAIGERPRSGVAGANVSRLVPIQVRITKPQELAPGGEPKCRRVARFLSCCETR